MDAASTTTNFFARVPLALEDNLRYRVDLRKRAERDVGFQRAMLTACKHDILFFLSAWAWLYEPRPKIVNGVPLPKRLPFLPWDHQIPIIKELRTHLGYRDILARKSRGEGFSWMLIYMALHDWLFDHGAKVGLVSRTEDEADDPDNMDSLMAKCLSVETQVLCSDGWKQLRDVVEGDSVIGSDGTPVKVLRVVEPYEADLFCVTFNDGTQVRCTGDHRFPVTEQWQRQSIRRLYRPHGYSLKTVAEMRGSLRAGREGKHLNYEVLSPGLVPFKDSNLPIDPYILGALLGDGSLSKTGVEITCVDEEIVDTIRQRLGGLAEVRKWHGISWGLCGGQGVSGISKRLKAIGLRGCRAWEKFIPEPYLRSSAEQRIELIRGLMDTDGTVGSNGFALFCTTSPRLAEGVSEVVRSLGGTSSAKVYTTNYSYKGERRSGRPSYNVCVSIPGSNPFRLTRKASKYRDRKHTARRRIVSIEPCGRGMVSCVTVDSDDHLFVIDGHILTHNCDWALSKLPKWMAGIKGTDWGRNVSKHSLTNFRNGAQINADAATGDVFRGGRLKWAAMDEFAFFKPGEDKYALASSQGATNSRLFVSTVNGTGNEFHRIDHEPSGTMVRIIMSWKDNPSKNRGLYRLEDGAPVAVDPINNPLPFNYQAFDDSVRDLFSRLRHKGFKLEGTTRSPWYDNECDRGGCTPQMVAQELDMDYGGSETRIFGQDFFAAAEKGVRPPIVRGNLTYHPETLEPQFDRAEEGPMLLWCQLDREQRPPARPYVIGCDIATGLGGSFSSNSTIQVIDQVTMEQVFEYADNRTTPAELADLAMALAYWFHGAYLAWEVNGPGRGFTYRVLRRKYGNVYYRRQQWQRSEKRTKDLGWATTRDTKEVMFGEILRSVIKGEMAMRSEALVRECSQYVRYSGAIEHVLASRTEDDGSANAAHGDRVIGFGVALMACRDRPLVSKAVDEYKGPPPPNSMAARKRDYDLAQEKETGEWDDRDNADLAAGKGQSLAIQRWDWRNEGGSTW